ncbi:hypothetical protein Hanom_Chr12g01105291 [Helianthus anomalus]
MMWHPRKIHSHLDLSLHSSEIAYQISGRNFFQVGDDVTTRISKPFLPEPILTYFVVRCKLLSVM